MGYPFYPFSILSQNRHAFRSSALLTSQVEKLVVIQGIVASVKTPRDKEPLETPRRGTTFGGAAGEVRKVVLKCSNCETVEEATFLFDF